MNSNTSVPSEAVRRLRAARLPARLVPIALATALAGCVADAMPAPEVGARERELAALDMYRAAPDETHPIAAVDLRGVDPAYLRQEVDYAGGEPEGTIVIETNTRFLYLVEGNGRALRYGVGIGKGGMGWSGNAEISRKAQWPRWTPTPDMMRRNPALNRPYAGGMEPGVGNPLGARALYLYAGGKDTLYRIHGTSDPLTIGHAVSSGCIRMLNQDVIDLYRRVPVGAKVIVREGAAHDARSADLR